MLERFDDIDDRLDNEIVPSGQNQTTRWVDYYKQVLTLCHRARSHQSKTHTVWKWDNLYVSCWKKNHLCVHQRTIFYFNVYHWCWNDSMISMTGWIMKLYLRDRIRRQGESIIINRCWLYVLQTQSQVVNDDPRLAWLSINVVMWVWHENTMCALWSDVF